MEIKEIHVIDFTGAQKVSEEIRDIIYSSNVPFYIIIAILETIKFELNMKLQGFDEDDE